MTLYLDIKDNQLTMALKNPPSRRAGKKIVVDELILLFERDLDVKLIAGLDKLFERNRLKRLHLKSVEIGRNIDKNSTYYRIILAFKKGLLSTK